MLNGIADRLERYMDLLSTRQRLVASNISNAATPGYQTRDIDFQGEFRNLTADSSPRAVEVPDLKPKNDGNNVSLDREARLLAENAIRFNLVSHLMQSQIRTLKAAIQEGKNS